MKTRSVHPLTKNRFEAGKLVLDQLLHSEDLPWSIIVTRGRFGDYSVRTVTEIDGEKLS